MNMLINQFPTHLNVDGVDYAIDTSYQTALQIYDVWKDNDLTKYEKADITMKFLYEDGVPENRQLAFEKAILYLDLGKPRKEESNIIGHSPKKKKPLYCFNQDSKFIFMAVDGVLEGKLSRGEHVHWWLFMMAFMEMPDTCMMSKIITLRSKRNKGKLSKEERQMVMQMKDTILLKHELEQQDLTEKQRKNAEKFWEAWNNGK